eukprot:7389815-Prymnesium_polylepis.2
MHAKATAQGGSKNDAKAITQSESEPSTWSYAIRRLLRDQSRLHRRASIATRVGHGRHSCPKLARLQGGRELCLVLLLAALVDLSRIALLKDVRDGVLVDGAHALDAELPQLQQRRLAAV